MSPVLAKHRVKFKRWFQKGCRTGGHCFSRWLRASWYLIQRQVRDFPQASVEVLKSLPPEALERLAEASQWQQYHKVVPDRGPFGSFQKVC